MALNVKILNQAQTMYLLFKNDGITNVFLFEKMGTIPVALLLLVMIDMYLCGSVAKASARTADSWALGEQRQERRERRRGEKSNPQPLDA